MTNKLQLKYFNGSCIVDTLRVIVKLSPDFAAKKDTLVVIEILIVSRLDTGVHNFPFVIKPFKFSMWIV